MTQPNHNEFKCNFPRTEYDRRLSKIERIQMSVVTWKEAHDKSILEKQKRDAKIEAKVDALQSDVGTIAVTLGVINEKMTQVATFMKDDKEEKKNNKRIFISIILLIIALSGTWAVTKYKVDTNTASIKKIERKIYE